MIIARLQKSIVLTNLKYGFVQFKCLFVCRTYQLIFIESNYL